MFGIPNISINITTTGKHLGCSVICYNCFQSGRRVSAGLAGGEAGAGGGADCEAVRQPLLLLLLLLLHLHLIRQHHPLEHSVPAGLAWRERIQSALHDGSDFCILHQIFIQVSSLQKAATFSLTARWCMSERTPLELFTTSTSPWPRLTVRRGRQS